MESLLIGKCLLTFIAAAIAIGPVFADFNATHATNPLWTGHARFHVVWQVIGNSTFSLLAIGLIWLPTREVMAFLFLATLINYVWISGFFITLASMPLFEGVLADENGIKPFRFNIFGRIWLVDTNLFGASVFLVLNSLAAILIFT